MKALLLVLAEFWHALTAKDCEVCRHPARILHPLPSVDGIAMVCGECQGSLRRFSDG